MFVDASALGNQSDSAAGTAVLGGHFTRLNFRSWPRLMCKNSKHDSHTLDSFGFLEEIVSELHIRAPKTRHWNAPN